MYHFNNFLKKYWQILLICFISIILGLVVVYFVVEMKKVRMDFDSFIFVQYSLLKQSSFKKFLNTRTGSFLYAFTMGILFHAFITIWTRAVGPRVRLDQLSKFTWRYLLFFIYLLMTALLIVYSVV